MWRVIAGVLVTIYLCLAVVLTGCGDDPQKTVEPASKPIIDHSKLPTLPETVAAGISQNRLLVTWAAQTEGAFEPCGCVAGMFGGLVRRGSLLSRVQPGQMLNLEGPGWLAGTQDFQRIKTAHYLRGLSLARIDAIALGADVVALGAEGLDALVTSSEAELPLVSANVQRSDGGPAIKPMVLVTRHGKPYAVTSVAPEDSRGSGFTVKQPVDALREILSSVEAPLIVMADLDEAGLKRLAERLPGVALIVGGKVHHSSSTVATVAGTPIIWTGNHGKTLGWWSWGDDTAAFELIRDTIPDHPELRQLVGVYQESLGQATLAIDTTADGLVRIDADASTYVGSQSCTPCHSDAHQRHVESYHAHAFASLKRKNYHRDPECLRCHVTALGQPGGYVRQGAPDYLREVSCESCHGPGSAHVSSHSVAMRPVTQATCTTCHDAENSPGFDYATYWPRISHGFNDAQ